MSLSSIIGQASRGADLYFVFRFLRLLTMDYKKTDAYKFKIIDSKGKALRKSADLESTKEKAAYTMLHRMVFKIRRLMEKIPGGRFVNYAAALFLLKEQKDARIWTNDIYMKTKLMEFLETDWEADAKFLKEEVDNMDKKSFKSFLSENKTIEESQELQAMMALDDAGIEAVIDKKGQIVIDKKDKKHAEKALKKSFRRGGIPEIQYEEVELDEAVNLKKLKKEYDENEDRNNHTENYLLLAKAFGTSAEVKKVQEIMKRNAKEGSTSKSDMDWMYKNINPYYDKIRNEEVEEDYDKNQLLRVKHDEALIAEAGDICSLNRGVLRSKSMQAVWEKKCAPKLNNQTLGEKDMEKLVDTVRRVLVGEDSDKEEPGTQGDKAEYQKKRKEVAKKFGVESCSALKDEAKRKECYNALDKAHVADHEEQVELKKMRKEESKKKVTESTGLQMKMAFDDANIKVKGTKGGKLVIDRNDQKKVTDVLSKSLKKGSNVKKVIDKMIKFEEVEDQVDPNPSTTVSKLFSHVRKLMSK